MNDYYFLAGILSFIASATMYLIGSFCLFEYPYILISSSIWGIGFMIGGILLCIYSKMENQK